MNSNRIGKTNWFDLPALDLVDAMAFYEGLFQWTFTRLRDGIVPDYWVIQSGQELIGGLRKTEKITTESVGPILYFTVDDLSLYEKRVQDLGGQLVGERICLNEGRGSYRWFRDRQGNCLALWSL